MYEVKFRNGAIYRTGLADSKDEAVYHAWIVYQNARMHKTHHELGEFDTIEDFAESIVVTHIPDRKLYSNLTLEIIRYVNNMDIEDKSRDEEFNSLSPNEVFHIRLEYEGLIGYDYWIKSLVKEVYGIDLDAIK